MKKVMGMSRMRLFWQKSKSKISSIGWALFGAFSVLAVLELIDGDRDMGDLMAPILLILLVNHLYIASIKKSEQENLKGSGNGRSNTLHDLFARLIPGISPRAVKWGMNGILVVCFMTPILLNAFSYNSQHVKFAALAAVSVWSLCLFTVSIKELQGHLKIVRLFYCQLALSAFVFSLFYLN